ncbi:MAG TPA: HNH endonuclease [Acidimicrobiales bacterium]|nr:HNH endonuclease [Acidimicrobiales bacterium]
MTGLRLEVAKVASAGGEFKALRPVGVGDAPTFSVSLSHNLIWAEAMFLPDTFSGSLIRRMGERILPETAVWTKVVEEGHRDGVETSIRINNQKVSTEQLPSDTWRQIEIECRLKLPRATTPNVLEESLRRAAGLCLSLVLSGLDIENIDEPEAGLPEGAMTKVLVNRFERNPVNRYRCIRHHGHVCWVCDFAFETKYGDLGAEFIEVHHVVPVSQIPSGYVVNPITEMVPLCSNCHSMIHRHDPPIRPEALRDLISLPEKGH